MTNNSPPLLSQLYDIEGLDTIGWWPLATGWWIVLAIPVLFTVVAFIIYWRKRSFERSWRNSTLKTLSRMEQNIPAEGTTTQLSELIRRIAIHQYSRKVCAGLEGKAWLLWLTEYDPEKFNWEQKAAWLVNAPYAPPGTSIPKPAIKQAIQAIRRWVK